MSADYTVLLVFEGPVWDRFLMARHRVRGWELPGGRVEPGEPLSEAARREWREETGLPLADLTPLVLHERPDGSRGHVFLGVAAQKVIPQPRPAAGEKVVECRFVSRLSEVEPLAFPDDPYEQVARAAVSLAAGHVGWSVPSSEDAESFVARLSRHPGACPRGHVVRRHPLARVA